MLKDITELRRVVTKMEQGKIIWIRAEAHRSAQYDLLLSFR